jgi:hypothetical protein
MSIRYGQIQFAVIFVVTLFTMVDAVPIRSISSRENTPNGQSCDTSTWQTVLLFYILNYGAHASTIKSVPGESKAETVAQIASALLLPFSGVYRACHSIAKGKIRGESDFQHALRLGALCEVRDERHDELHGGICDEGVALDINKIHGQISVPKGYHFKILRDEFEILRDYFEKVEVEFSSPSGGSIKLSSTCNPLKAISAIVQLVFACITLYRSRGDQLNRYGYAAFGLTVVPFAVMSFVNLIANITTPDYPAVFMVRTETMDKAERDGGIFVGAVATLYWNTDPDITASDSGVEGASPDAAISTETASSADGNHGPSVGRYVDSRRKSRSETAQLYGSIGLAVLAFVAPYAIIGGLTGFKAGSSTSAQRGWTMSWLVIGQVYGGYIQILRKYAYPDLASDMSGAEMYVVTTLVVLFTGVPAIGGYVVVTQMIIADGYCASIG